MLRVNRLTASVGQVTNRLTASVGQVTNRQCTKQPFNSCPKDRDVYSTVPYSGLCIFCT